MIIAVIESPLQLLNAYEAAFFFKSIKIIYIIRLSGEKRNDEQILHLVDSLQLKNLIKINIPVGKVSLIALFKMLVLKVHVFYLSYFSKKIIIGNFDSKFIKLLLGNFHRHKFLLVDDGAKSLSQQSDFSDENHIDFFSMYDLIPWKGQTVFKNEYVGLHTILADRKIIFNKNKVLFLGSKLSEVNIVNEQQYLNFIRQIQAYYHQFSLEIIYVPHRGECIEKVKLIQCIFNVQVVELDFPIELIGFYRSEVPYKVSSFYSTALFSLNSIYKFEVECFEFNYTELPNYDAIKAVYDLYRTLYPVIALKVN